MHPEMRGVVDPDLESFGIDPGSIHVCTPLGLGVTRVLGQNPRWGYIAVPPSHELGVLRDRLRRAIDKADSSVDDCPGPIVFTDLHLADEAALDLIEDLASRRERLVVLASPGSLPERLLGYPRSSHVAGPVDAEALAAAFPALDGASAANAHGFCGGWPEALVVTEDGSLEPSTELRRFLRGIQIAHPHLAATALILACAVEGLTVEQVATCIQDSTETAFQRLGSLERLGAVGWSGPHAVPAFPAVRVGLTEHEADRRSGSALLAAGLESLSHPDAPIAAAEAGIHQGESAFGLLDVLVRAEESRDVERWQRTAIALTRCDHNDLRREGLLALARLAVLRGDAAAVDRVFDAIAAVVAGAGLKTTDDERVVLAREFAHLNGLDAPSLGSEGKLELQHLFPNLRLRLPDAVGLELKHVRAAVDGLEVPPDSDLENSDSAARFLHFIAVISTQDFTRAQAVDLTGEELAHLGELPHVLLCAWQGRFEEAATALTAQIGPDWATVTPLHRSLALLVASGLSVERTRELVPHVDIPEPGRLGSIMVLAIRARAELVLGRTREANRGFEELLRRLRSGGLHGLVGPFAPDALDAFAFGGDLDLLADAEPTGTAATYVRLARALRGGSPEDAAGEISTLADPYRVARLRRILGRWLLEHDNSEGALGHLQASAAVFRSLGAPVDLAVSRSLIRRIDPRHEWSRNSEADSRSDGVTLRESEVLALVIDGLTNAEIGAQLHISVATVKRHVSSLLRRFGVSSRRQLVHTVLSRQR